MQKSHMMSLSIKIAFPKKQPKGLVEIHHGQTQYLTLHAHAYTSSLKCYTNIHTVDKYTYLNICTCMPVYIYMISILIFSSLQVRSQILPRPFCSPSFIIPPVNCDSCHQIEKLGRCLMFNVPRQEMLQKNKHYVSPMHIHTFCCIQSMYLHSYNML